MQEYLNHPSEDNLERFVLHQMQEEELESLESHILACDSCVARLEYLELNIAATKMALAQVHQEKVAESFAKQKSSGWSWLKISGFSLAGTAAAVALTVSVLPNFRTVERDLSAYRGSETTEVPANHPLFLHLNAKDLPAEAVSVELVSEEGKAIWKGAGAIDHQKVDAHLPRISEKGNYLIRLYAADKSSAADLLREFSFQVQ